jgi:circadian clock protein KaiC
MVARDRIAVGGPLPPELWTTSIHLVDLGEILRAKGLAPARDMLIDHVSRIKPAIVVIDSFKTFDDLATSIDELRKFVWPLVFQVHEVHHPTSFSGYACV